MGLDYNYSIQASEQAMFASHATASSQNVCVTLTPALYDLFRDPDPVCITLWNFPHYSEQLNFSPFYSVVVLNTVHHTISFATFCELFSEKIKQHFSEHIQLSPMNISCQHYLLDNSTHGTFKNLF